MTTFEKLRELIAERVGINPDSVKSEANLIADLGFDSLDRVKVTMAIEEEWDIDVDDETFDWEMITVGGTVMMIDRLSAEQNQ